MLWIILAFLAGLVAGHLATMIYLAFFDNGM